MFESREDAAIKLSIKLLKTVKNKNVVVVALTRGGVVLGRIIANYLNSPLDIVVVKKIGAPDNSELAIGVVGPKKTVIWNNAILSSLNLDKKEKDKLRKIKDKEREAQEELFNKGRKLPKLSNKSIILVDDGVATGATVLCAQKYLKKEKVRQITLAVPVIAEDTLRDINEYFDMVIYLKKPKYFYAVGQFYKRFLQITDKEVVKLL